MKDHAHKGAAANRHRRRVGIQESRTCHFEFSLTTEEQDWKAHVTAVPERRKSIHSHHGTPRRQFATNNRPLDQEDGNEGLWRHSV